MIPRRRIRRGHFGVRQVGSLFGDMPVLGARVAGAEWVRRALKGQAHQPALAASSGARHAKRTSSNSEKKTGQSSGSAVIVAYRRPRPAPTYRRRAKPALEPRRGNAQTIPCVTV
jgi:hypothetical protein